MGRRLLLAAVFLLAGLTRFYRLAYQSLWSDEGNSVVLARAGFGEIAARTAFDIHPPFYYWLLKIWVRLFGEQEFAVRSLSAVLGVLLVGVIYLLGRRLFNDRIGLIAAFIAALSPFQVYYAQETRMYMLLALLGAVTVWLAVEWWRLGDRQTANDEQRMIEPGMWNRQFALWSTLYVLAVTFGLYTQYAFPIMVVVINLTAVVVLWSSKRRLGQWLALQLIPILLYLPWLPTALRQITTWPSLRETASTGEIGRPLLGWLSLGPSLEAVSSGWLGMFVGLALVGLVFGWQSRKQPGQMSFAVGLLGLWLLLPAGVTAVLFRPAYLKIFLIASPAFCLLLALGVAGWRRDWLGWLWSMMALGLIIWPMGLSLQAYYDDPRFQRDNYRGIAAYIEAVATGADAVVLNAPGQQEVFGYYYQFGPHQAAVYPLPQQRPLNPAATQAELAAIQAESQRLYAVYWATEEADPTGLIEDWLDENTFKANDIWFGNVRLVSYATANQEIPITDRGVNFGRQVELLGAGFAPQTIAPGEILQIRLIWQSDTVLSEDYTVFIQLLDSTNHLVGQRDAQPQPSTSAWSAGQPVVDDHGLYLEPGTPPGPYSLIAGLYHSRTGERLRVSAAPDGNDFLTLGTIEVTRREKPLPIEAFRMQHRLNGPPLRGYDLYKLGHASEPMGRLQPGDPLHLNLYWQQSDQLAGIETVDIQLLDRHGQVIRNWADQPLAAGYPSEAWSAGEIVRSQYDFFLNDVGPGQYQLAITLGSQTINVAKEVVVGEP